MRQGLQPRLRPAPFTRDRRRSWGEPDGGWVGAGDAVGTGVGDGDGDGVGPEPVTCTVAAAWAPPATARRVWAPAEAPAGMVTSTRNVPLRRVWTCGIPEPEPFQVRATALRPGKSLPTMGSSPRARRCPA